MPIAPGETRLGVTVDGKASIYAVEGNNGSPGGGPLPVLDAVSIEFTAGSSNIFEFSASGNTNCCSSIPDTPADGNTSGTNVSAANGLSASVGNSQLPLLGVFTDGTDPAGLTPPPALGWNRGSPTSLSPALRQVFYIGDGRGGYLNAAGAKLQFTAPPGATKLFLGFADAWGFSGSPGYYGDNTGSLSVDVSRSSVYNLVTSVTPIQAVENTENEDLVANKNMIVRVRARIDEDGAAPLPIRAVLCVTDADPGCALSREVTGTVYARDHAFSLQQRLDGEDSLNIWVFGRLAELLDATADRQPKSYTFRIVLSSPDDAFDDVTVERSWTFRQSETLRIFTMPYGFKQSGGTVTFPDHTLFGSTHRLIQSVYPVDEDLVTNEVMPLSKWDPDDQDFPPPIDPDNPPDLPGGFELSSFWGVLFLLNDIEKRLKRALMLSARSFENELGVGILPMPENGVSPLNGYFEDFFSTTLGISSRMVNRATLVVEKNESFVPVVQAIAAHEVGHTFGLKDEYCFDLIFFCDPTTPNSPPQSAAQGDYYGNFITESMLAYDIPLNSGERIVTGRVRVFNSSAGPMRGYMGFPKGGVSTAWTGPTEYNHLFNALTVPPSAGAAPQVSQSQFTVSATAALAARDVVHLTGVVGKNGTGSIQSTFVGQTESPLPTPLGVGHSLEFRDGEGNVLDSTRFEVDYRMEIIGGDGAAEVEADIAPISILAELPPGTAAIQLRQDGVEQPLDEVVKTANIPTVAITDLRVLPDGIVEVAWLGDDADADDRPEYAVVYSSDGTALRAVGTSLFGSSMTFDPVSEGGAAVAAGAFVRVLASDGFNTGLDEASLDFGGSDDAVLLRQYNTHGPGLPGMCSRRGCIADKRHTLVGQNVLSDRSVRVDYDLVVVSVPDESCTVSGAGIDEVIPVASEVMIPAGRRSRHDVDLTFACDPGTAAVGSDFVLSARVRTTNGIDLTPANNAVEKTQTVK